MKTVHHPRRNLLLCLCLLVFGYCTGPRIHAEEQATAVRVERAADRDLESSALRPGNGLRPRAESSEPWVRGI
jgi:hypothetical protein